MDILKKIEQVHGERSDDPNHRYRSWEHCYSFFQQPQNRAKGRTRDACLHLGFYLASWGMYRGSSFLLQQDYTVHTDVVRFICDNWPPSLRTWDRRVLDGDESLAGEIVALANGVKGAYMPHYEKVRQKLGPMTKWQKVSDVLATKCLLGTMGCVPAYDKFFCAGLGTHGITKRFNLRSVEEVILFAHDRRDEFMKAQKQCRPDRLKYPILKLEDMYFWQLGNDYLKPRTKG